MPSKIRPSEAGPRCFFPHEVLPNGTARTLLCSKIEGGTPPPPSPESQISADGFASIFAVRWIFWTGFCLHHKCSSRYVDCACFFMISDPIPPFEHGKTPKFWSKNLRFWEGGGGGGRPPQFCYKGEYFSTHSRHSPHV